MEQENKKITYEELVQSLNNFNTYGADKKQIKNFSKTETGKQSMKILEEHLKWNVLYD